jgi:hypothetical protein
MANKLSNDIDEITQTIMDLTGASRLKALGTDNLLNAMELLPFDTTLTWDKINGRYAFSNEGEDEWRLIEDQVGHQVYGPNFSFVGPDRELVIAKGLHYYYHKKQKG